MDEHEIRLALIEEARSLSQNGDYTLQSTQVIVRVARSLNIRDASKKAEQQLLLTIWSDLFREGLLAWGADVDNANPPFCHLTARGHRFLSNVSRDPYNPDGYMAYMDSLTTVDPIARSYIQEALNTFRNQCYKATAVMVGCAVERLVLRVAETLVVQVNATGKMGILDQKTPSDLQIWPIARVFAAVEKVIAPYIPSMDESLRNAYNAFWQPFTQQARLMRNDAGHPKAIDPVDEATVHGVLLTFPAHAKLAADIMAWIPQKIV